MAITKKKRSDLKSYFVKNAIPTESQFGDLIDGTLNQADDGIFKLPDDPLSIVATGGPDSQKKTIQFFEKYAADATPAWVVSLNPRANASDAATARPGFSVSTNAGVSRLFIDKATGNVGIGTTAPKQALHVNGAIRGHVGGGAVRLQSDHGYIDIGPRNADWAHFGTDRPAFYFNKEVRVDSGKIGSYDENLQLCTRGAARITVRADNGFVGIGVPNPAASLDINGSAFLGHANRISNFGVQLKSGFYEGSNPSGDVPDTSHAWSHLLTVRHSNAGNNHQLQIAASYAVNNRLFFRKIAGGNEASNPSWNEVATCNGNLELLRGGNPLHFTSAWTNSPARATDIAEISNDTGSYKTLMIVGNRSNGGPRRVSVWDTLEVNGLMRATGGVKVDGNLGAHIDVDGSFYRYQGQVYITVDDNLNIRDMKGDIKFHFNTNNGIIAQEAWKNAAFQNGWVNYGGGYNTCQYFKDKMGIVHLKGMVKNGRVGKVIFTLPAGYRPLHRQLHGVCTHNNAIGRCDVLTDGQVHCVSGNARWFSLDGITFRAHR